LKKYLKYLKLGNTYAEQEAIKSGITVIKKRAKENFYD
jgi:hypothetical protein